VHDGNSPPKAERIEQYIEGWWQWSVKAGVDGVVCQGEQLWRRMNDGLGIEDVLSRFHIWSTTRALYAGAKKNL